MKNNYRFVSFWRIEAPLQAVFDVVLDSLRWPDWWRGVERVEQLDAGDANGIGSVRRYTWRSLLGYRLRFDALATRIEPAVALEATVDGDVQGRGCWTFSHEKGITTVRYEWDVQTAKRWMTLLSPFAHAVFAHNHHALMRRGAEGLARVLQARLLGISNIELPSRPTFTAQAGQESPPSPVNWRTAATAGLFAGIVATFVQLFLWWAASYTLPDILLRDTRLAAAIIMGPGVLPPATFDWRVLLAASLVHFALSAGYGLLQAPLTARLPMRPAAVAGAVFGLLLFGTNMYGFTAVFPWFVVSRDWITMAAHAAFGLSAALTYKLWDNGKILPAQQRKKEG